MKNIKDNVDLWDWLTPELIHEMTTKRHMKMAWNIVHKIQDLTKEVEFFYQSRVVTHNDEALVHRQLRILALEADKLTDFINRLN